MAAVPPLLEPEAGDKRLADSPVGAMLAAAVPPQVELEAEDKRLADSPVAPTLASVVGHQARKPEAVDSSVPTAQAGAET